MAEITFEDWSVDEEELRLKDHETVCYACGLTFVRALPECGNCLDPGVPDVFERGVR